MIFLDTESCGLTGPIILIQIKELNKTPVVHNVWKQPVKETLELLEWICQQDICGYNLSHDWFHINKLYNLLKAYDEEYLSIKRLATVERDLCNGSTSHARYCLKPKGALDLFLYARCGPLQKLMVPKSEKHRIVIKRVPRKSLPELLPKLPLPEDIYFYHAPMKAWRVDDIDKNFVDLSLHLAPSMGLKPIYNYIFKRSVIDYPIPARLLFKEKLWKPFGGLWPAYISQHIDYWENNKEALQYAINDVVYLEDLYNYWDQPGVNDYNSTLACLVGCVRWRGFSVNLQKLKLEIARLKEIAESVPYKNSPVEAKNYILSFSKNPEIDKICLPNTRKETLIQFDSPAAKRVLEARKADKRLNILYKLLEAKRLHPNFVVVGTKSGRMAGVGRLNPQGIPRDDNIREIIEFDEEEMIGGGGDFEAFEVTIADPVYNDSQLHADLLSGKSIHGIFGSYLYNKPYEEVLESKHNKKDNYYNPAKNCVFGFFYGAQIPKTAQTAGIPEEQAAKAYNEFYKKYPQVKKARDKVSEQFQSVVQPDGVGTKVIWREPADYIETLFGYRRYYTLENSIIKALFNLAVETPVTAEGTVVRRDREQTIIGATQSALYHAVFQLQNRNVRSANNHVIQGSGAEICKRVQCSLWELQPVGVYQWRIVLMNIHDEIEGSYYTTLKESINEKLNETIQALKETVPLLSMSWKHGIISWKEK